MIPLVCVYVGLYVCESMFACKYARVFMLYYWCKRNNLGQSRRFMQKFDVFATKLTLALMFNAKVGLPLSTKFLKRCKPAVGKKISVLLLLLYLMKRNMER